MNDSNEIIYYSYVSSFFYRVNCQENLDVLSEFYSKNDFYSLHNNNTSMARVIKDIFDKSQRFNIDYLIIKFIKKNNKIQILELTPMNYKLAEKYLSLL